MYNKLILITAALVLLSSCSSTPPPTPQETMPEPTNTVTKEAPQLPVDAELLSGKQTVTLKTSLGDMTLELDADAAPKTVTNFVTLAKDGYYDDLIFHRVIEDFMIQGGDPRGNGTGGESVFGAKFEDEINAESYGLHEKKLADFTNDPLPDDAKDLSIKDYYEMQGYVYDESLESLPMVRGALAMANSGPNTNGSQFFIIHAESTEWLEGKHTVFGKVTEGMDVLDAIANVEKGAGDRPVEAISFTIEVVDFVEEAAE